MLILIGESTKVRENKRGEFYCTTCQTLRPYVYKQARSYFNLFMLPVLPLQRRAEYIECQHCGDSYHPSVLQAQSDAPSYAPAYYIAVVGTLLKMVGSASNPRATLFIQRTFKKLTGQVLPQQELLAIAEQIKTQDFMSYMQTLGYYLNNKGKNKVLAAAYLSMEKDGELNHPEQVLLNRISSVLDFPPGYAYDLVQEMNQHNRLHKDVA